MREFPMYSPHPKGLHYTRYTYSEEITVGEAEKLISELNTYRKYDKFKWVFEETPQDGSYQRLPGLSVSDGYTVILTNSIKPFNKGDILFLEWATCPAGALYVITDAGVTDYIYTPKPRQAYQRLELKRLFK